MKRAYKVLILIGILVIMTATFYSITKWVTQSTGYSVQNSQANPSNSSEILAPEYPPEGMTEPIISSEIP